MLNVSLPKQRARTTRPVEVRPRRVEIWLATLPQANAKNTAKQLYQALFKQNRIPLEPDNRLSLMELYRGPVISTTQALAQSYVSSSFPLLSSQRASVDIANRLLGEMANGYKIVANDLINQGGVQSQKTEVVLSIQRAIFSIGRVLLNAYQAYAARSRGVWHELHQLYQYSEIQQLLHYPVPTTTHGKSDDDLVTLSETYLQISLLGACTPYGLLQGECELLYQLIPRWLDGASITKKIKTGNPSGRFLISLITDAPPVPLIKANNPVEQDHLRVLNAIEVAREVHSVLKGYESSSPLTLSAIVPGMDVSQVDLLRRFGRVLGGVNMNRRSMRSPGNREIPICTGMNAIHFYANGEQHFQSIEDSSNSNSDDVEDYIDLTGLDLAAGSRLNAREVSSEPREAWRGRIAYEMHLCDVKDESANGLRICVTAPTELRVRVGDLVGLQYSILDQWRVGVIRWIRVVNTSTLNMGVQMLAPMLSPVAVKRVTRHKTDDVPFVQALLLPGNDALKQPESLLTPLGTYHPGEKLLLSGPDAETTVVAPFHVLDRTGSYDQLLLEPGEI